MLSCIGILQASLINSQGHANWWFYYLVTKQAVTALIILTFYSYGVSVLVFAMAVQTFVMWPAAVWMVLRILKSGAWAYLKPFLAPTVSCLVMLVGVLVVKMEMVFEPAWMRLGAQVGTGALLYCATLALLDRRRIFQMRDLVMKRGAVSA